METLPRFVMFEGYEVKDFKELLKQGFIEIELERKDEKDFQCYRCGSLQVCGYLNSRYVTMNNQ